jgi:hypothetical protein
MRMSQYGIFAAEIPLMAEAFFYPIHCFKESFDRFFISLLGSSKSSFV